MREPLDVRERDFAVVFFRNVLIYFRPESQGRVASAVARTMADDGYLFLGGSESMWQLYPDLEPIDLGNCFSYRWARKRPEEDATETSDVWQKLEESTGKFKVIPSNKLKNGVVGEQIRDEGEASAKAARAAIVDALKDGLFEEAHSMSTDATERYPEDALVRALEGLCFDLMDQQSNAVGLRDLFRHDRRPVLGAKHEDSQDETRPQHHAAHKPSTRPVLTKEEDIERKDLHKGNENFGQLPHDNAVMW